jgi:prepilin-type N-terminal cleavage/methylation domain-containing protein
MAFRAATRRRGFTLLELLVVMSIIVLLSGISMVKAGKVITQTKVQRAAQKLQTDVQQAFAIAGRNRKPVMLRWSSSLLELQVTDRAQTTVYRRSGVGAQAGLGLTAADVTVYPTALTVFPNGLAADTMYIRLSKNGYTKILRVSRAGIVRLQ